jgi:enamine deaminase RidA (YjgF/YER057c/UK114 family)
VRKEVFNPDGLWDASPRSYSHVVKVTDPKSLIFVAGVAPVNERLEIIGGDDIEAQTRATFENIGKELAAAGATLADIVDMTVYLLDIKRHQWPVRNVRAEFFEQGRLPVSTMIQVAGFALDDMLIEVDVIAAV